MGWLDPSVKGDVWFSWRELLGEWFFRGLESRNSVGCPGRSTPFEKRLSAIRSSTRICVYRRSPSMIRRAKHVSVYVMALNLVVWRQGHGLPTAVLSDSVPKMRQFVRIEAIQDISPYFIPSEPFSTRLRLLRQGQPSRYRGHHLPRIQPMTFAPCTGCNLGN